MVIGIDITWYVKAGTHGLLSGTGMAWHEVVGCLLIHLPNIFARGSLILKLPIKAISRIMFIVYKAAYRMRMPRLFRNLQVLGYKMGIQLQRKIPISDAYSPIY